MDSRTIRTPDQRLRIFVSSTLEELGSERRAVRRAIERMRLAPVMFELGARPHPPRELYRAYLEQSDVFVGLYWERYGWVAPGEQVSGLEDEYRLSGGFPKLLYIKEPATAREERLVTLLQRVRSDGDTSFKRFSTPAQLTKLLEDDLALLLTERFLQAQAPEQDAAAAAAAAAAVLASGGAALTASVGTEPDAALPSALAPPPLPVPLTTLVGRDEDIARVRALLDDGAARLITLTGPGGVGKSRLAVQVASDAADAYPDGAAFVELAPLQDPALVPATIARALGVQDPGDGQVTETLLAALAHRRMLLVLDDFDRLVEGADLVPRLLAAAPGVTLLVTSRVLLRLSGEHTVEVRPLDTPGAAPAAPESTALSPAVQLFVARARAVRPDFEVTIDNADDLARICRALDGLPLAIELAAARIRVLTPRALAGRLDRQLPLLVGGARDLPERQRTMRSAIEWSADLLGPDERRLLALCGVFTGPFSVDAVEALAERMGVPDPLEALAALVDGSLVLQRDRGGRSLLRVLTTVREYARERLGADAAAAADAHAAYYAALADRSELELEGPGQRDAIAMLGDERENLAAALKHLIASGRPDAAMELAWDLYIFWWVSGYGGAMHEWAVDALASPAPLADRARAIGLFLENWTVFRLVLGEENVRALEESVALFARVGERSGEGLARLTLAFARLQTGVSTVDEALAEGEAAIGMLRDADDPWSESVALLLCGRLELMAQRLEPALARFRASGAISARLLDDLGVAMAEYHEGWVRLLEHDLDAAQQQFERNLTASARMRHDEGVAFALEGMVAVAALRGEVPRAGTLLGAAESVRERAGLYGTPSSTFHLPLVEPLLAGPHAGEFASARAAGAAMPLREAIHLVLDRTASASAPAVAPASAPAVGRSGGPGGG